MKNSSELKFLKGIIESDLLLLDNKETRSRLSNLHVTSKNLKQIYRMLRFVKKQKSSDFHFCVENKYLLNVLQSFITVEKNISFDTNFPILKTHQKGVSVIAFGDLKYSNRQFFEKIKTNNAFLTAKINSQPKNENCGLYFVNTETSNLKSVCFYVVFFKHILC